MSYFYSNEIVFRGHPDKVADQISDYLLDQFLAQDPMSRCGIEVVGGKGKIFVTGEVTSNANVDVGNAVRYVLKDVGYSDNYEIINNIGQQSPDIALGVDVGGAGDQGMMFGYACRDTEYYLPTAMVILQKLAKFYDQLIRKDKRFLPDGKAQITGEYTNSGRLIKIKDFVISYQNTEIERKETDKILTDFCNSVCAMYDIKVDNYCINPTGKFLIGGFDGDAGLTGRKIVVDNYQSFANVGGGAFSGKDPTKVDRSAAYKARQLAIECLDSLEDIEWCEIQLSYAIGIDTPMAVYARTDMGRLSTEFAYGESTPTHIINDLHLRDTERVKYYETAKFGHFGNPEFPWESSCKKEIRNNEIS